MIDSKQTDWLKAFSGYELLITDEQQQTWEHDRTVIGRSLTPNYSDMGTYYFNLATGKIDLAIGGKQDRQRGLAALSANPTIDALLAHTPAPYLHHILDKEIKYLEYACKLRKDDALNFFLEYYRVLYNDQGKEYGVQLRVTIVRLDFYGCPWIFKISSRCFEQLDYVEEVTDKLLRKCHKSYDSKPFHIVERELTVSERKVMELYQHQLNKERANAKLYNAETTLLKHQSRVMHKLGVHSKKAACCLLFE